jgi:hypothetical protein
MFAAIGGGVAKAEKMNLSPEDLRTTATHVITGRVTAVYERTGTEDEFVYTRYLAEIRVAGCEKGGGVEKGDLVYVRYWRRARSGNEVWFGIGGHRGLPSEGAIVRAHLARNAYDGFGGDNTDGGFNVIGANGFETLDQPRPSELSRTRTGRSSPEFVPYADVRAIVTFRKLSHHLSERLGNTTRVYFRYEIDVQSRRTVYFKPETVSLIINGRTHNGVRHDTAATSVPLQRLNSGENLIDVYAEFPGTFGLETALKTQFENLGIFRQDDMTADRQASS